MTLDLDDKREDDFLADLGGLRTYDVSPRRARRLRRRCHAMLQAEPPPMGVAWLVGVAPFRRILLPTLGGAWCVAYLVEIIRCTAAIYSYFGTQ